MAEGDLITYLNVWRAWEASGRSGKWAAGHFLNHRTLLRAADIRSQLHKQLRYMLDSVPSQSIAVVRNPSGQRIPMVPQTPRRLLKLDMLPQAAGNMEAVRKALTAGLFFNAAQLTEALDVNLVRNDGTAVYKLIRSTCTFLVSGDHTSTMRRWLHCIAQREVAAHCPLSHSATGASAHAPVVGAVACAVCLRGVCDGCAGGQRLV